MRTLYMLDTDTCSYVIKGTYPQLIAHIKVHEKQLCISAITLAELLYGASKRQSARIFDCISALQELVEVKDWTTHAAEEYAKIRTVLENTGNPIGNMDMLIAAAAQAEPAVLVTNNTAHFSRIKTLKIQNWLVDAR